jgi:hypothetical protein
MIKASPAIMYGLAAERPVAEGMAQVAYHLCGAGKGEVGSRWPESNNGMHPTAGTVVVINSNGAAAAGDAERWAAPLEWYEQSM